MKLHVFGLLLYSQEDEVKTNKTGNKIGAYKLLSLYEGSRVSRSKPNGNVKLNPRRGCSDHSFVEYCPSKKLDNKERKIKKKNKGEEGVTFSSSMWDLFYSPLLNCENISSTITNSSAKEKNQTRFS